MSAAAGLLFASAVTEPDDGTPTKTARSAGFELTVPAAWRAPTAREALPAIDLAKPVELTPESGPPGAALIAGQTPLAGPGLLPAAFLERLAQLPVRTDPVRLVGGLHAYRYRTARLWNSLRSLTLYAAPTTHGVAVIGCIGPRGARSFHLQCERAAGSLSLTRGTPIVIDPRPAYTRILGQTVQRLSRARAVHRGALARSRTRRGQARLGTALTAAYARAASSLADAPAGPIEQPANSRMLLALRRARSGYAKLASAARRGRPRAFARATKIVRRGESAFQRELARFTRPR